jgi:hypothetical protein
MAQLDLVEIHEHAGPQDEYERKYVHVKEDKLAIIDQLKDPEQVIPQQGGNRYICQKCDGEVEMEIRKVTTRRTTTTLRCPKCRHETQLSDTGDVVEDTGWRMQNGQKAQKQLAFEQPFPTDVSSNVQEVQNIQKQLAFEDETSATAEFPQINDTSDQQEQNAEHCVYTSLFDGIPDELKVLAQWVCWRYEPKKDKKGNLIPGAKPDKVPYVAELSGRCRQCASCSDPTTWRSYDQAKAVYEQSLKEAWKYPYDGIMFAFKENGGYVGIDHDDCIDENGNMSELARARMMDSWAEISPSQTGYKQIVRGSIERNIKRADVEMYDHGRFFTITGMHLPCTPAMIKDQQEQVTALFAEIAPPAPPKEAPRENTVYTPPCPLADDEVLEKARGASNGTKFSVLWEGKIDGYGSQSEADLALCSILAYWTDGDPVAMDRLFRSSGLYRTEKWDRKARAGETYGEGTIRIARERQ